MGTWYLVGTSSALVVTFTSLDMQYLFAESDSWLAKDVCYICIIGELLVRMSRLYFRRFWRETSLERCGEPVGRAGSAGTNNNNNQQ